MLPDGGPHSAPVWSEMEGNRIAFLTSPGSRKAHNLQRDPRMAISITDRGSGHTMAHVRGRVAEILDGDEAWLVIDRISHKYTGQPYPERTDRLVFLVVPEHAMSMVFG